MKEYAVYSVNGPVVKIKGKTDLALSETVRVGKTGLLGEVLSVTDRETTLEVYETTAGLSVGEPIRPLGHSLSILLGPGLLGSIYDGVGRPLTKIALGGEWILPGADFPAVDTEKKYPIHLTVKDGDRLTGGSIFGETKETSALLHRLLLPPDAEGVVRQPVPDGSYTVIDTLFYLETSGGDRVPVAASHTWPVRKPRPTAQRLSSEKPLLTGERIIDVLFPIAKGGTAAIPGGFGTGKTVVQHQLAKFSEADVIVYVGCGERGNEMTQVLEEFSHLTDPRTGKSMLERTVLIAHTSNMPVAAREASI